MGTDQESYCGNRMDSYEERRNKVRRFQLTSDIFFCKVLEDKEACQEACMTTWDKYAAEVENGQDIIDAILAVE